MITYIQKFNELPPELKAKVSGEKVMSAMRGLESKYDVKLATVVMRLMIKDISILDLIKFLKFEYDLDPRVAEELVIELKEKVLWEVAEYLGFSFDDRGFEKNDPAGGLGASSIKTSNFFFSSEDEHEVKELTKKLETYKKQIKTEEGSVEVEDDKIINEMAEQVAGKISVKFSAEEMDERFKTIIKTYLKGVRSKVDSKQTMMKSIDLGGLDFDDILSSRVLKIADEIKAVHGQKRKKEVGLAAKSKPVRNSKIIESNLPKTKSEEAQVYSNLGAQGARDVDYDFSKLKDRKDRKGKGEASKVDINSERQTDLQEINKLKPQERVAPQEFKIDLDDIKKAEPSLSKATKTESAPAPQPERLATAQAEDTIKVEPVTEMRPSAVKKESNRPKVEDVKYVPKLTGPIDELAEMSLADFRRLGINAQEIASKIIQKIDNLEKESYEKRLEGIQAWRKSPVNAIYLGLANQSISEKKKVFNLIAQWRNDGKEVLKPEEFSAILELNKKIRF